MKLIKPPTVTQSVTYLNGQQFPGKLTINNCEIFVPSQKTDAQKTWNKLKYNQCTSLELGKKINKLDLPEDGYILYGVIPITCERKKLPEEDDWCGETFVCSVDHFSFIPTER